MRPRQPISFLPLRESFAQGFIGSMRLRFQAQGALLAIQSG